MAEGSGYRKTVLIGDHFILYDVPAIVAALPYKTAATVERIDGEGWMLEDNQAEMLGYKEKKNTRQIESINRILEVMKIDIKKNPIRITYGGDFLPGSGLGASAASCVSLAKALNEEFNSGLSIDEINHISWEGEAPYHGKPSGVDNTASCYGGILLYSVKGTEKRFEKIVTREPIHLVLGNSGIRTDTALLRPYTEQLKKSEPALYESRLNRIRNQVWEMKNSLEANDLKKVGAIMTENQKVLVDMGLSHDTIDFLCSLALGNGALGAKVTGGGRGGHMVALAPDKERQEKIARAIEKEGYTVIRATIR